MKITTKATNAEFEKAVREMIATELDYDLLNCDEVFCDLSKYNVKKNKNSFVLVYTTAVTYEPYRMKDIELRVYGWATEK